MSWQPAPPRPILYMNASPEAEEARALLETPSLGAPREPAAAIR